MPTLICCGRLYLAPWVGRGRLRSGVTVAPAVIWRRKGAVPAGRARAVGVPPGAPSSESLHSASHAPGGTAALSGANHLAFVCSEWSAALDFFGARGRFRPTLLVFMGRPGLRRLEGSGRNSRPVHEASPGSALLFSSPCGRRRRPDGRRPQRQTRILLPRQAPAARA